MQMYGLVLHKNPFFFSYTVCGASCHELRVTENASAGCSLLTLVTDTKSNAKCSRDNPGEEIRDRDVIQKHEQSSILAISHMKDLSRREPKEHH